MVTMNEDECLKEDRLSELPDHIIHEILRFLPIRSAAQTLILSHRWKNVFSSIPYLDFTTIAASKSPLDTAGERIRMEPPNHDKDINFLNKIFSLRDTNFSIKTLKLNSSQLSSRVFELLIKYPKINNIQELDVKVRNKPYFDIPWSIINCGRLRVLRLNILFSDFDDLIKPSVMKREFKFLHTMTLNKISFLLLFHKEHIFTDSSFPCLKKLTLNKCYCVKKLIFRCSSLEDLIIEWCDALNELDIYGLKLERLKVVDCSRCTMIKIIAPLMKVMKLLDIYSTQTHVFLEKLYILEKAVINIFSFNDYYHSDYNLRPENIDKLSNMMIALSNAKFLKFKYESNKIFTLNCVNNILVNKFESLRTLKIYIQYNDFSVIATFFKNSPYLDTLVITIDTSRKWDNRLVNDSSNEDKYWEDQAPEMNSFLNHIRTVKLDVFLECYNDISLAKFLLKHGKVLEEMVLCVELDTEIELVGREIIKSALMKCSKASSKAKFVFQ